MSFLTEYFDEYRQHPIKKTKICRPEERWAKLEGNWMDPRGGTQDREWTDEEIENFIKTTMKSLRGQSTYYNDYCAHLSPVLGYVRPCLYRTGLSDYQGGVARLAYELVRDDRIPRYRAHNGCRPRWGLPPDGTRQPELDGAPFDGERLF